MILREQNKFCTPYRVKVIFTAFSAFDCLVRHLKGDVSQKHMQYDLVHDNSHYVIRCNGKIVCTPAGNNLTTRFPALLGAALEDLKNYGSDPAESIGMYSLICSYSILPILISIVPPSSIVLC
ncbi:hypothetical protein KA005_42955 [bacterium]|nr:hypothetical protein [bacterium]